MREDARGRPHGVCDPLRREGRRRRTNAGPAAAAALAPRRTSLIRQNILIHPVRPSDVASAPGSTPANRAWLGELVLLALAPSNVARAPGSTLDVVSALPSAVSSATSPAPASGRRVLPAVSRSSAT